MEPRTGAFTATTLVDTNGEWASIRKAALPGDDQRQHSRSYRQRGSKHGDTRGGAPLAPTIAVMTSHRVHAAGPFDLYSGRSNESHDRARIGPAPQRRFHVRQAGRRGSATVTEGVATAGALDVRR